MSDDDNEPLLINTDPKGQNNMGARALYMQRKLYDKVSYSDPVLTSTTPINLRKKILYGKTYSDIVSFVVSDPSKLVQIPSDTETVVVLDFVRDAFLELKQKMEQLVSADLLEPNSAYYNLSPKSGYQNVNVLYQQHMSALYTKFINSVVSYKEIEKIKDFETFLDQFLKFIDRVTPTAPITRGAYIKSRDVAADISGLVINLENDDASRDENKISKYIDNINLSVFKHACEICSFKIDKHVPWRIVFDIKSPAANRFYEKYGVNKNNVLNSYYNPSYFTDLFIFKKHIIDFYNSFAANNEDNYYQKIKISNDKTCLTSAVSKRQLILEEEVNINYPMDMWIRLYTFIRGREENLNWNQEVYENHVKNAILLYQNTEDAMKCFKYIHSITNYKNEFGFKNRDFYFK